MEPEDLDFLYQIENDMSLWAVGVTNVPYSRFLLHEYITQSRGDIYADGQVRLMAENEEGRVIGIADLTSFSARHCRAEVGIIILKDQRCQGYGCEILRQLADYGRSVLHLHQLYAVIDIENKVSQHLFEKAGYEKTAEMSDWLFDGHSYRSAVLFQKQL